MIPNARLHYSQRLFLLLIMIYKKLRTFKICRHYCRKRRELNYIALVTPANPRDPVRPACIEPELNHHDLNELELPTIESDHQDLPTATTTKRNLFSGPLSLPSCVDNIQIPPQKKHHQHFLLWGIKYWDLTRLQFNIDWFSLHIVDPL